MEGVEGGVFAVGGFECYCTRLEEFLPGEGEHRRVVTCVRFLSLLRQPLAERGHVVLVMLERVAGDQLPGTPLLRHILEAVRVIEVLVIQCLDRFQQSCVCLPLFVDDVM